MVPTHAHIKNIRERAPTHVTACHNADAIAPAKNGLATAAIAGRVIMARCHARHAPVAVIQPPAVTRI